MIHQSSKLTREERKALQKEIQDFLNDWQNVEGILIAARMMETYPQVVTKKTRAALARARFELDLCEAGEVWHGEFQGKELTTLSRPELLHLLGIVRRTRFAIPSYTGTELANLHLKAMIRREVAILCSLEAHLQRDESFLYCPEKGALYYSTNYPSLSDGVICRLLNESKTVDDLLRLEVKRRENIVQARAGHYYDKSRFLQE